MKERYAGIVAAAAIFLALTGPDPAGAQALKVPLPAMCQVPDDLLADSSPLPHAAKQLKAQRRLKIVALGSSSTLGMGASGPDAAYPARLEAALVTHLPGVTIQVVNKGISRQSAKQMLERAWPIINHNTFNIVLIIWSVYFFVRSLETASIPGIAASGLAAGVSALFLQQKSAALVLATAGFLVFLWLAEGRGLAQGACRLSRVYGRAPADSVAVAAGSPLENLVYFPLFNYAAANRVTALAVLPG